MSNRLNSQLTSYLRGLARRRNRGTVTADDVVNYLTRKDIRVSQNERISITRSVLGAPNFAVAGSTQSRRPEARGRVITEWAAR